MEETINPIAEQVVENAQESNTNGVPGSLPGETQTETKARLYKVKVDGEDLEVDEEELLRGYAHNKAASKRMQEASMSRKEAEQVLRLFKENPREAFKVLGQDVRQFAESVINDELAEALMDPREKELREYKRQVEQYENERRAAQAHYEKQQLEHQLQQQAEVIQNEIISTLENSGLPKTDRTVSRIVYYMQSALQAGYNVTPNDVIGQVKEDYKHDMKSLLGGLTEDQIEMFLDNDIVRKIAKSTIKSEKKPTNVPKEVNQSVKTKTEEKKKIMSPREFFNNVSL